MSKKQNYLDRLSVPAPCTADWGSMTGDDRTRHCAQCDKKVYNLSKMTRDQAEALVARMEGRLCARIELGPDGIVLTKEISAGPHLISRRASPVASAIVSAMLGLGGTALAQSNQQRLGRIAIKPQQAKNENCELPQKPDVPLSISADPQVVVTAATPVTVIAAGGDVAMPTLSLRELYEESEVIVIARVGKAVEVKKEKQRANNESILLKTALEVSSFIKGESKKKTVYVYHWGWGEDRKFPGGHDTGDRLLVFLNPREEGKGFEVSHPGYGVKKLPDADLALYIDRMEELAEILKQEKRDINQVIEWLVRCAEDPATRWEGAYELLYNADSLLEEKDADAAARNDESSAAVSDLTGAGGESDIEDNDEEDVYDATALLLDASQKERLARTLYSTPAVTEQDDLLIQVIKSWKDDRLVPFLVSQLRRVEDDPPEYAEELVRHIADVVEDDEIQAGADEYYENTSYEDKEEESDEQEMSAETDETEEEADDEDDSLRLDAAAAKRNRAVMLQKFLLAVEKKLAR